MQQVVVEPMRAMPVGAMALMSMQVREYTIARRNTVARRRAKERAGTKRKGLIEYRRPPVDAKDFFVYQNDLVQVLAGEHEGEQARVTKVDRLHGVCAFCE